MIMFINVWTPLTDKKCRLNGVNITWHGAERHGFTLAKHEIMHLS